MLNSLLKEEFDDHSLINGNTHQYKRFLVVEQHIEEENYLDGNLVMTIEVERNNSVKLN